MEALWECYNSPSQPSSSQATQPEPDADDADVLFEPAFPEAFAGSTDSNDENREPGDTSDHDDYDGNDDYEGSPAKKLRKEWEFVSKCESEAALEELKSSLLCGSRKWTLKSTHTSVDLSCCTVVFKCIEVRKCHCKAQIKVVTESGKHMLYKSVQWHDHDTYFGAGLSHAQRSIIDPLVKSRQAQPKFVERTLRDAGMPAAADVRYFLLAVA